MDGKFVLRYKDRSNVLTPEKLSEMDVYIISTDGSMALELINEGDAFVGVKRAKCTEENQIARGGGHIILRYKDSVTIIDPRNHKKKHECTVGV